MGTGKYANYIAIVFPLVDYRSSRFADRRCSFSYYLYVSASRAGSLPSWLSTITDSIDSALWAILYPTVLACIAYSYVASCCLGS
jgi:hypothetical protein